MKVQKFKGFRFLLFALVGALIGYVVASFLDRTTLDLRAAAPWLIVALIPLLFLSIFWHEAGHVIGGRLAGMRPVAMVVGFVTIFFDGGRPNRFKFNKVINGGLAICKPDPHLNIKRQTMALVIGGPVASLLLAVILIILPVWGDLPDVWASLVAVASLINAVMFVMTIIPGNIGGLDTDGARFFGLLFDTEHGRALECCQKSPAKLGIKQ